MHAIIHLANRFAGRPASVLALHSHWIRTVVAQLVAYSIDTSIDRSPMS